MFFLLCISCRQAKHFRLPRSATVWPNDVGRSLVHEICRHPPPWADLMEDAQGVSLSQPRTSLMPSIFFYNDITLWFQTYSKSTISYILFVHIIVRLMPRNQMKAVVGFASQFYPQWDSAKVASMCEKLSRAAEEDGDELCLRWVMRFDHMQ